MEKGGAGEVNFLPKTSQRGVGVEAGSGKFGMGHKEDARPIQVWMNRAGDSYETGLSREADEAPLADEFSEIIGEVFVLQHPTPKFCESGVLDLTDSLAGDVELVTDFLESFLLRVVVESEAKPENFKFSLG